MKRLFEDPELSAQLRDDLLRSRAAGQDYPAAAKLLQLRAALSDPARQPLGEPSGLRSLAGRVVRLGHPGWKLLVLAAVGGGAVWLTRPAPAPRAEPAARPVAVQAPAVLAASAPEAPAPVEPARVEPTIAPSAPLPETGSGRGRAKVAQSSRREIAQLVRIRAALERDPAAAYRLAQQSEREFPRGVLSEEREALSIVALAKSGSRAQAQQRARAFFARYPESPMRELLLSELR